VFVIDDEPLIRRALSRQLRFLGTGVEEFACADEVLPKLDQEPDLVICDYHLPVKDGLSLAADIRARWPDVKIIMITGAGPVERLEDALARGHINGLLAKPWRTEDLQESVMAVCRSSKRQAGGT
jgi:CheY-like chemotaxis protein